MSDGQRRHRRITNTRANNCNSKQVYEGGLGMHVQYGDKNYSVYARTLASEML